MTDDVRNLLDRAAGGDSSARSFKTVWERSLQLRRRALILKFGLFFGTIVLVGASVVVVQQSQTDNLATTSSPSQAASDAASPTSNERADPLEGGRLFPAVEVRGGTATMPLVFPNGISRQMVYPSDLDLQSLGVRPSATLRVHECVGDIVARYDDSDWYKGAEAPIRQFSTTDGRSSELWYVDSLPLAGPYLIFHFDDWTLGFPDSEFCDLEGSDGEELTRSLGGRQTNDGFLLLTPERNVAFARTLGPEGPRLTFGVEPSIEIFFQDCAVFEGRPAKEGKAIVDVSSSHADWCLMEEDVRVQMRGGPRQVEPVIDGLAFAD